MGVESSYCGYEFNLVRFQVKQIPSQQLEFDTASPPFPAFLAFLHIGLNHLRVNHSAGEVSSASVLWVFWFQEATDQIY